MSGQLRTESQLNGASSRGRSVGLVHGRCPACGNDQRARLGMTNYGLGPFVYFETASRLTSVVETFDSLKGPLP